MKGIKTNCGRGYMERHYSGDKNDFSTKMDLWKRVIL
jgi:hypothetical protein